LFENPEDLEVSDWPENEVNMDHLFKKELDEKHKEKD